MHKRLGLCAGLLIIASAAWGQTSSPPPSSHAASAAVTSSASPDTILKKGMAYADARKALIAHGWVPAKDPQCKEVIGADDASQRLCNEIPELVAYSGEGEAVMHFIQGSQRLAVWSQGDIDDWKVSGLASNLTVSDWEIKEGIP